MNQSTNKLIKSILLLCSLATTIVFANEQRTKKDLSEIQNALEQSQEAYNEQRKKIANLQKNLKSYELDIAKNAKALNMAAQSVKETQIQQREQQKKAKQLDKKYETFQRALAALINYMNSNYEKHIITIEEPIEYIHEHKRSIIEHKEI